MKNQKRRVQKIGRENEESNKETQDREKRGNRERQDKSKTEKVEMRGKERDTGEGIQRNNVTFSYPSHCFTQKEIEKRQEKMWKNLVVRERGQTNCMHAKYFLCCGEAHEAFCRLEFTTACLPGVGAHRLGTESAASLVQAEHRLLLEEEGLRGWSRVLLPESANPPVANRAS